MVKKSKRYINKGQSVTFQLVDKPHADPSGFEADNVRVWHATSDEKRKEEQLACGIYFEDDYDYTRHLRDRFGEGTRDQEEKAVPLWEEIEEGQFDDVVSVKSSKSKGGKSDIFNDSDFPSLVALEAHLTAVENVDDYNVMAATAQEKPGPHWDEDIAQTMADNFTDFCDDLEDDFVTLAGGVADESYDNDFPELGAFDGDYEDEDGNCEVYREGARADDWRDVLAETEMDQHTDPLLEERKKFLLGDNYMDSKSQKSRFTEYSLTSSAVPRSECQTDLDDHFEIMYGEYDDLEVGALDHEEVEGHLKTDHPAVLHVLGLDGEGKGQPVVDSDDDPEMRVTIDDISERLQECASDVDSDDLFPEPEPKPEFDCESILSTYSNIYNRPKVIKAETKVQLDQSGMPKLEKDYPEKLPHPDESEMDRLKWIPPNIKRKDETKEETRERQKIQKEEQRLRRIEKKNNKLAFKMEEIRQQRSEINKQRSSGFKY